VETEYSFLKELLIIVMVLINIIKRRYLGEFSLMKEDVILVNTGRGGIIAEDALVEALKSKKVYSAGMDVTESSLKDKDNPLFKFDNVTITPHVGANTDVSYRDTLIGAARNVVDVLNGKLPTNILNPEVEIAKELKQGF